VTRLSAALLGLAVTVAVAGCAGTDAAETSAGSASSPAPTSTPEAATSAAAEQRIEVVVTGGQVSGDSGRLPVAAGEHVTLVITTDEADEVHVHGYDLAAELSPGQPTEIAFDATIPGVFEVELHETGTQLLSLQVG
jgi:hypothetical protein